MPLSRDGPGLLLRDIRDGDPEVAAVAGVLAEVSPDIVLLAGVDHDLENVTAKALRDALAELGADYPHLLAPETNRGRPTGLDLDGDGRFGEPEDNHGFADFTGQNGLLLLSRYPIRAEEITVYTDLLWRDLPDAALPFAEGAPFPSQAVHDALRLSTTAHWSVPVEIGTAEVEVMAWYATPPVFDGPENFNGLRNAAEATVWLDILGGAFGPAPAAPFVLLGAANLDPFDGDGRGAAMQALLGDPRLQDPGQMSAGGQAAEAEGHLGPDAMDTVDWPSVGRLRVDYALPSAGLEIADAGVFWPAPVSDAAELLGPDGRAAGSHRLVWVDLVIESGR